jgi:hypothetical protein
MRSSATRTSALAAFAALGACAAFAALGACAALAAAVSLEGTARADVTWLPGPPRAIPRSASASRDTPVLEYAYGPRAQASIGAEPGLLAIDHGDFVTRVGLYAMVGLENATDTRAFPPGELWRGLVGASVAWDLPNAAKAWLVPGADLEVALVVGHESDHATVDSTARLETPPATAIPFGAGGDFVAPDVAVRLPAGPLVLTARLQDRVYFNAFPLVVGDRASSDGIAAGLHEGLAQAAGADLIARWRLSSWAQPQLALFGEHLFAREPSVDDGGFFRAMLGLALPGWSGELLPFGSFDTGNGKGLLVDRRETRLSIGVRYAAF